MAAASFGLPPPEPLQLLQGTHRRSGGNSNKSGAITDETATDVAKKDEPTRVATLLTVIGEDAVDVYNTLTGDEEGDELKIEKVLEKFESYWKNTMYERYVIFLKRSRAVESPSTTT